VVVSPFWRGFVAPGPPHKDAELDALGTEVSVFIEFRKKFSLLQSHIYGKVCLNLSFC
jgi:hypothetical protein